MIDLEALLAASSDDEIDRAFDALFDEVYGESLPLEKASSCDQMLAWVASDDIADRLHVDVILACVRLPTPLLPWLSNWNDARDACHAALQRRGKPADALLPKKRAE